MFTSYSQGPSMATVNTGEFWETTVNAAFILCAVIERTDPGDISSIQRNLDMIKSLVLSRPNQSLVATAGTPSGIRKCLPF